MKTIVKFPLSHFEEIAPVLHRCFSEFWTARFARGERSFPYDLKLYVARRQQEIIGTVGLHDYQFLLPAGKEGYMVTPAIGLSDLGVLPAYRGQGHAGEMQEFVKKHVVDNRAFPMIPLCTDKPAVYRSRGWEEYLPDNSREIQTKDFPSHDTFRINAKKIGKALAQGKRAIPANDEERIFRSIWRIYASGISFPGKVMRSTKTWLELFGDPAYQWRLEGNTYFLYCEGRLVEAYSSDPAHPVNHFTPVNGGHDDNKVMINLLNDAIPPWLAEQRESLQRCLQDHSLQFPIADTF
ncbi:MAG: GNAT family N-acetyltransferase [Lentisphaeria bacterium]|nr:GNAT family N-acetyltransferase [Lentisphaeria bacterium]